MWKRSAVAVGIPLLCWACCSAAKGAGRPSPKQWPEFGRRCPCFRSPFWMRTAAALSRMAVYLPRTHPPTHPIFKCAALAIVAGLVQ